MKKIDAGEAPLRRVGRARRRNFAAALALLSVAASETARAAEGETVAVDEAAAEEAGVRVFEPDYYEEFDPADAGDMVGRTPGFSAQEQTGGRGLDGVRSNILIDGERPPPKGGTLFQRLNEMPIDRVARLELIDAGARPGIDMQGYQQVLNVVTVPNPPPHYEIEASISHQGTGDDSQNNEDQFDIEGLTSFTWDRHDITLRADLENESEQSPAGFVSIDPANPVQRVSSLSNRESDSGGVQLDADFDLLADRSLTVNGRFAFNDFSFAPISLEADPDEDAVRQSSGSTRDEQRVSAEYRQPLGEQGTLMLALVDSRSVSENTSSFEEAGETASSVRDTETGETAARIVVTRSPRDEVTLRGTATGAFNYFEGGFQLFENGVEQVVEGSDNRVEETRGSLEGSLEWGFAERWTLQTALGVEAYDIVSRDAATGTQIDPRGSALISFRQAPRRTLSLETSRSIGQLGFSQFLASSSLSSDILTAGAAELEPVRSWTHTAKFDQRFDDIGVLELRLTRREVDNPVNTAALSDTVLVAQNTDPETIDTLNARTVVPLDRFNFENFVINANYQATRSETIDPVTGEEREVSNQFYQPWFVQLRKDPGEGDWSWGVSASQFNLGTSYSARSIVERETDSQMNAFVQWEPVDGLRLRANYSTGGDEVTRIFLFGATRTPGLDPSFISERVSRRDGSGSVSVRWRNPDRFEFTASLSSGADRRTEESLTAFGAMSGTSAIADHEASPEASLRLRIFN
ncbi:MAG: hypothetical protein PVI23_11740 [Maricaulaceae bacterium]